MAIAVNEITIATVPYDAQDTDLVITKPANVANGNVLLAFVMTSDNNAITDPAGWVQIDQTNTAIGNDMSTYIGYKIITDAGSEPANYTWTVAGNEGMSGGIIRLTGVDTTTPNDAANSQTDDANWDDNPCPTMNTATNGAMVFAFLGVGYNAATPTEPGGTTAAIEIENGTGGNAFSANVFVSYFTQAVAGATGDKLWAFGTVPTGAEWHAYQCAMRPTVAVGNAGIMTTNTGYWGPTF